MSAGEWLPATLLVQAAATWFMTGLVWFVQVVHYPLMARVGGDAWVAYERGHTARTGIVVLPAMLVELGSTVLHVALLGRSAVPAAATTAALAWTSAALLAAIWISTFFVQMPLHGLLERRFDPRAQRRLCTTNWLRTAAWTARSAIVAVLLREALG